MVFFYNEYISLSPKTNSPIPDLQLYDVKILAIDSICASIKWQKPYLSG